MDAKFIFSFLGPLFLLLGVSSWFRAGKVLPQAKSWLLVGTIFSGVAIWQWF